MHKYRLIAKKGEGTFSEVLKAQSIKNGKYFAIKCMKNHFDSIEQVRGACQLEHCAALQQAAGCPAASRVMLRAATHAVISLRLQAARSHMPPAARPFK